MMNALDALIARNLQPVSLIRPRVASLFEPVRGSAGVFAPPDAEGADGENRVGEEISGRENQEPHQPARGVHRNRRSNDSIDGWAQTPIQERLFDESPDEDLHADQRGRRVRDPGHDRDVHRGLQVVARRDIAGDMEKGEAGGKRGRNSPRWDIPARDDGGAIALESSIDGAVRLVPGVVHRGRDAEKEREDLRSGRSGAAYQGSPSEREPEPSVHITIGRIEVRAASTGGSPRKPAATSSKTMTLEEYLSQRAKRERT